MKVQGEEIYRVLVRNDLLLRCSSVLQEKNEMFTLNGILNKEYCLVLSFQQKREDKTSLAILPSPISPIGFFCSSKLMENKIPDKLKQSIANNGTTTIVLEFQDANSVSASYSPPRAFSFTKTNKKKEIEIEIIGSTQLEEQWKREWNFFTFRSSLRYFPDSKGNTLTSITKQLTGNISAAFSIRKQTIGNNESNKIVLADCPLTIEQLFAAEQPSEQGEEPVIQEKKPTSKKKGKKGKKQKGKNKKGKSSASTLALPDLNFGATVSFEEEESCTYAVELLIDVAQAGNQKLEFFDSKSFPKEEKEITIQTIWYGRYEDSVGEIMRAGSEQIREIVCRLRDSSSDHSGCYLFHPNLFSHPISCFIEEREEVNSEIPVQVRKKLHEEFLLAKNRPNFKSANILDLQNSVPPRGKRLTNVHEGLGQSTTGGQQYLVEGIYEYYHYMQDRIDDKGWGCAYRSLQTICSWFRIQSFTSKVDPTHREIQETLVRMGDKPPSFVGSNKWIGAFEISLCLDEFYGISCKIINCNSGAEIPSKARELQLHFMTQGTPVMIGGGVLAYTLLGIDFNEGTGETKFLILDPHYVGKEDLKTIQDAGWCNWKESSLFRTDAFYNLCLPQCPNGF